MPEEISDKERQVLEELVTLLGNIRGSHTELVTVLIPAGTNIHQVSTQLFSEAGTAENIKSKQTRTSVVTALETIIRKLKEYKQTPPNGLAIFCGNVSEKEGGQDIQIWAYEPPKALRIRTYRCDKTFVIEPLKEMLEVTEIYGLLAIDRQQATIGALEGRQIKVIRVMTSGVPGKVRAGGQCLGPNTLIMKENGEIIPIKESHNPLLIVAENFNTEKTEETPVIAKWENTKKLYRISTMYPHIEIDASEDHSFFVRTEKGIEEKSLVDVNEGDYLLMPEKISLHLKEQLISFTPVIKQAWNTKKVHIPQILTPQLSKILGYYLGDGSHEIDRISFSEQRKEVAVKYCKELQECFKINPTLRLRESKGYYQIRVGSRTIAQFFKDVFKSGNKTLDQTIPSIVLRSPDKVLASFISGFFDAEGYVSKGRVALGINNEWLAKQLQFTLLRLGIIASINTYDNRRNPYSKKIRYTLAIDDLESLKKFAEQVKFSADDKQSKALELIKKRGNRNKVRQIVVNGREIARIIKNSGLSIRNFRCPDFFVNKKQMSKEVFKTKIINRINNSDLRRRLEMFYQSNLIAIKIKSIVPLEIQSTVDIETKNHNFIANGLVVHNSSQRYHRITEGLAKDFFKRVAETMKEIFFNMPKLKGILVGGPIPTKEEFLEQSELVTKLKEKVIAVKDIGYVDEHGLKLLVEASHKDIEQQEFIKEREIIQKFFETLGKNRDKATYGLEKTRLALERGAVEILLISKELSKDNMQELEKEAERIGSSVFFISTENQEGQQFLNLTKGVGAILRFQIE